MLRAAWRSLLGRKARLLMSTFAIVLGVAFVAGTLVFTDTINRSFTTMFSATVGDVVVRPAGTRDTEMQGTERRVPEEVVDRLRDVPGAARVDGTIDAYDVFVVDKDGKVVGSMGAPGIGTSWNDAPGAHGTEGAEVARGREPRGPGEVVLDVSTAEKSGYLLGEEVLLNAGSAREPLQRMTLVGTATFGGRDSFNGASVAVFENETARELLFRGEPGWSTVWVTAEEGVSQPELREAVATRLPDGLEARTGDAVADENGDALLDAISFLTIFLLVFAGVSLVVGAFLIVNTFSILVAQRSRELALLRALGASRRQVSWSVQAEALVLGLLGSTIGLGLGVVLAMVLRFAFARFGLDLGDQALVFRPRTVLAAYGVGVLVTMLAAWLPARRTGRIAPVQALRDDVAMPESSITRRLVVGVAMVAGGAAGLALGLLSDVPYPLAFVGVGMLLVLLGVAAAAPVIGHPFLAASAWLYRRLLGSVGNLAGQNGLRNPRRTTATSSALMIGLTLACLVAIMGASMKASVDRAVAENFRGDYVVSNVVGQPFATAIGDRIEEIPAVERVARQRYGLARLGDDDSEGIGAVAPADRNLFGLVAVEGSVSDLRDGTAVVHRDYAEDHGLAVGDRLRPEVGGRVTPLEVVALTDPGEGTGWFPVTTTLATLERMGFPPRDSFLVVETARNDAATREAVEEVVADLPIVTVKDQQEFAEEQRGPFDQLVMMVFALLGLALLIAVLGIVNTLALSVIERTREIGLLRAVGLGRAQLRRMITLESVVIAVLGAVLGVLLGTGFGVTLMYSLRDEGLEVISVPAGQLAAFLGAAVLVGVLAAILPARRAARLDVLRAIATE